MKYAIIAAGEGSRLVEEGVKTPKPLVNINGETMIGRLIRIFTENNAESISIIVNQEMTGVKEYLDAVSCPVPLNLVVKSTPSSMHSFYELRSFLKNGKFCLTTVDTMFREDEFASYIQAFEADNRLDGLMAVTDYIDDEKPLYVSTRDDLSIDGFKDSYYEGARYISGGIYALTSPAINVLENTIEAGVSRMRNYQRALVESGLILRAFPFGKIIDVDHAGDIPKVESFVKR